MLDSLLLVPLGPGLREIAAPLVFDTTMERSIAIAKHLETQAPNGEVSDAVYRLARLGLATLHTLRSDTLELEQMRKEASG
jgi:hypothetical protein